MPIVYLSLGSNLGDREQNLGLALQALNSPVLCVRRVSSIYETTPFGETKETVPDYLNCVAEAETSLAPIALLDYTQATERQCGRTATFRWGPRVIDIDIVWYEGVTMETERLTLPHTHSRERAFVLVPLAELVPELELVEGRLVSDLIVSDNIKGQQVRRLSNRPKPSVRRFR